MGLSKEHIAKLDQIVQKMQANKESDAYIQNVVNDYKAVHSYPTKPGPLGNPSLAALQAIPGPMSMGFGLRKALPALGGAAGGYIGGVPGAGLLATAAEGSRQIMEGQGLPGQPPLDFAGMRKRGEEQAIAQLVGTGLSTGGRVAAEAVGPMATRAAKIMSNRTMRRAMETALPFGGYASHGIPGALAGAAIPYMGRAALKAAASPKTAAFLSSPAFLEFARQSPRAAAELTRHLLDNSPKP